MGLHWVIDVSRAMQTVNSLVTVGIQMRNVFFFTRRTKAMEVRRFDFIACSYLNCIGISYEKRKLILSNSNSKSVKFSCIY